MRPSIGDVASRTRFITEEDIELFTRLTGDANPLHYDTELAEKTRFEGIVVQGGITSGLLNAVVAEELPGPGTVFLNTNFNFRAPVRPGDAITATVEVTQVRVDKPITHVDCVITNQDGVTVLDGTAVLWTEDLSA